MAFFGHENALLGFQGSGLWPGDCKSQTARTLFAGGMLKVEIGIFKPDWKFPDPRNLPLSCRPPSEPLIWQPTNGTLSFFSLAFSTEILENEQKTLKQTKDFRSEKKTKQKRQGKEDGKNSASASAITIARFRPSKLQRCTSISWEPVYGVSRALRARNPQKVFQKVSRIQPQTYRESGKGLKILSGASFFRHFPDFFQSPQTFSRLFPEGGP